MYDFGPRDDCRSLASAKAKFSWCSSMTYASSGQITARAPTAHGFGHPWLPKQNKPNPRRGGLSACSGTPSFMAFPAQLCSGCTMPAFTEIGVWQYTAPLQ